MLCYVRNNKNFALFWLVSSLLGERNAEDVSGPCLCLFHFQFSYFSTICWEAAKWRCCCGAFSLNLMCGHYLSSHHCFQRCHCRCATYTKDIIINISIRILVARLSAYEVDISVGLVLQPPERINVFLKKTASKMEIYLFDNDNNKIALNVTLNTCYMFSINIICTNTVFVFQYEREGQWQRTISLLGGGPCIVQPTHFPNLC